VKGRVPFVHSLQLRVYLRYCRIDAVVASPRALESISRQVKRLDFVDAEQFPPEALFGLAVTTGLESPKQLMAVLVEAIDVGFHPAVTPVVAKVDDQSIPNRVDEPSVGHSSA
jgi:hypothetical protein